MNHVANIAVGMSIIVVMLLLLLGSLFAVLSWLTGKKAKIQHKTHKQYNIPDELKNWACHNPFCLSRNRIHARFCRNCGVQSHLAMEAVA